MPRLRTATAVALVVALLATAAVLIAPRPTLAQAAGGELPAVPCVPLGPAGVPQFVVSVSVPGRPDVVSAPAAIGAPATVSASGDATARVAVSWDARPSIQPASAGRPVQITGARVRLAAPTQPAARVTVYLSVDGQSVYGFGVDGTPPSAGQRAKLPGLTTIAVDANGPSITLGASFALEGTAPSPTVALVAAVYPQCQRGSVQASLRLSDPVPWSSNLGLPVDLPVGTPPSIQLTYTESADPAGTTRRRLVLSPRAPTDIVATLLANERDAAGAVTAVSRGRTEVQDVPGPLTVDVADGSVVFDSPNGELPLVIGQFARRQGGDAVLPPAPRGTDDAIEGNLDGGTVTAAVRLAGLRRAEIDVRRPVMATAVGNAVVTCPSVPPQPQPGGPAVAIPVACLGGGTGEAAPAAPVHVAPPAYPVGGCPPRPPVPEPVGVRFHLVHRRGPLRVAVRTPERSFEGRIESLPATLTLELSVRADGVFASYEAASQIDLLTLDTTGSAPFAGRATTGRVRIEGIPGNLRFHLVSPGEEVPPCVRVGARPPQTRQVAFTVVGGTIGLVDVTLTDQRPNEVARLLDAADGFVLEDTADAFVVRAKIHGLRSVALTTGDCAQAGVRGVPGLQVAVVCSQHAIDLDATTDQPVRVALRAFDEEKDDNALTVLGLDRLSPATHVEVNETRTDVTALWGHYVGAVRTDFRYRAAREAGPLTFATSMGRRESLTATVPTVPTNIGVCFSPSGQCINQPPPPALALVNVVNPSQASFAFHASAEVAVSVADVVRQGEEFSLVEDLTFRHVSVAAGSNHVYVDTPEVGIHGGIHLRSPSGAVDAVLPRGFGAEQFTVRWELPQVNAFDVLGVFLFGAVAWVPAFASRVRVELSGELNCPPGTRFEAMGIDLSGLPLCTSRDDPTTTTSAPATTTTVAAPPSTSTTVANPVTTVTLPTTTTAPAPLPLQVTGLRFYPSGSRQPAVDGNTCRATATVELTTNGRPGTVEVRYEFYSYNPHDHSVGTTRTVVQQVPVTAGQTTYQSSSSHTFNPDNPYGHGVRVSTSPPSPNGTITSENSTDLCAPG